jgi:hypothetical protein
MRTVFLLGSGISRDACMPDVKGITEQVVAGDCAFLNSAEVLVIDATNPNYELQRPPVLPVLDLIRDLCALASSYFGREPNYEEISQLARQVDDALFGEYESAAVMPQRLEKLMELTHKYITDTVRTMLNKPPQRLDHLKRHHRGGQDVGAISQSVAAGSSPTGPIFPTLGVFFKPFQAQSE